MSSLLDDLSLPQANSPHGMLRNKMVPQKVEIFVWRVMRRRIPVRVELDKRGIHICSVRCPLCVDNLESVEHSMVFCKYAMDVWERVYNWWNLGTVTNLCINEIFKGLNNDHLTGPRKILWQVVEWVTGYMIWKNRNQKVFGKNVLSSSAIIVEIQVKIFEWVTKRSKKFPLDWHLCLIDLKACGTISTDRSGVG
ncbi:uncharacterized protein [Rutidosis leptorrhynchoides]|uniref:uncharacterized protein n=1 Tax=Rutidosis leptorrhynchoides TaxID=125765 RepID=UPI003A98F568